MRCEVEGGRLVTDSLEFFLADTCNLACEHCASSAPYLKRPNFPALRVFEESLGRLAPFLRSRQLKLLGGEPLLNRELGGFLRAARRAGIFGRIRLTTNGLLLPQAPAELWESVDVLEVSRYAGGLDAAALERIRARAKESGVALEVHEKPEFFAAVVDEPIPDAGLVGRIYAECGEAHHAPCHTLYAGTLYRCSRVHTLDLRLSELGVAHQPFLRTDGLALDADLSLDRLRSYLESPSPLEACRFCLGTSGRRLPQRQLAGRRRAPVPFERSLLPAARGFWRRLWGS